jgi:hypothetical protein
MTTDTTIKLGTLDLNVIHLEDGSYAAPGLTRLLDTPIYRYQDCWYWVSPDGLPPLEEYTHLDYERDAYMSFDGNRLAYLHFNSVEPGREICEEDAEFHYSPVPNRLHAIIDFCLHSRILSDDVMLRVLRNRDLCYSGDSFNRAINRQLLLRDTTNDVHRVNARIHLAEP